MKIFFVILICLVLCVAFGLIIILILEAFEDEAKPKKETLEEKLNKKYLELERSYYNTRQIQATTINNLKDEFETFKTELSKLKSQFDEEFDENI